MRHRNSRLWFHTVGRTPCRKIRVNATASATAIIKESTMSPDPSQADLDNHANQLNPNHEEYWHSRGHDEHHDEGRGRPIDAEDTDE